MKEKQVKQSRNKTKKHTTNENKRNQHIETHENFSNIKNNTKTAKLTNTRQSEYKKLIVKQGKRQVRKKKRKRTEDQETRRPEEQGTRGPLDQTTRGPDNEGTRWRGRDDQGSTGLEDQGTRAPKKKKKKKRKKKNKYLPKNNYWKWLRLCFNESGFQTSTKCPRLYQYFCLGSTPLPSPTASDNAEYKPVVRSMTRLRHGVIDLQFATLKTYREKLVQYLLRKMKIKKSLMMKANAAKLYSLIWNPVTWSRVWSLTASFSSMRWREANAQRFQAHKSHCRWWWVHPTYPVEHFEGGESIPEQSVNPPIRSFHQSKCARILVTCWMKSQFDLAALSSTLRYDRKKPENEIIWPEPAVATTKAAVWCWSSSAILCIAPTTATFASTKTCGPNPTDITSLRIEL